MAIDEQQVMQAIYDLIYDSLTMPPPGGQAVAKSESTYLTLSFPGIALDETQFANPWSPTNPNGSPVAGENLAMLADTVPLLSPIYVDSGVSVDKIYGQIVSANVEQGSPVRPPVPRPILRGVRPAPVREATVAALREEHPAEVFKTALASAPVSFQKSLNLLYAEEASVDTQGKPIRVIAETPLYRNYLEKRAVYAAAVTSYMADRLQQKSPPSAPPPPQVSAAFQELKSARSDEVEAAVSEMQSQSASNVEGLFLAARLTYELTKRGSLYQPGLFWHMCQAIPYNWISPAAVFAQVNLQSDALRLNPASRVIGSRALSLIQGGLWRQRASLGAAWVNSPVSRDTAHIRISYRFARVEIRRPWLDPSLLSLRGWSMPGRPKHSLSTGTVQDNPGIFSLLPSSMIVARDVQISAQWTSEEVTRITTAVGGGGVMGFGPFAIAGPSAKPGAIKSLRASFDGLTISVPGLQLIGWLNRVVPACPPLNG